MAMRNADLDVIYPQELCGLQGPVVKDDLGAASGPIDDFDVPPTDAPHPAGPQRLEHRLLGCPSAREVLRGLLAILTVHDLRRSEHALKKQLPVTLDHASDAEALRDIRADSEDFH